ncbi:prostaglandin-endoperoxide synthase 1 [Capronia epimyces CBS 606.96]|uniref:Prostaglandin-endoperoxide synthase 1 n=1 Tax=Capronia epimyces CBS 606.96 TaxID=1182542 RepID=W9YU08_9EURO|nr:prostaglandin-endoperoxide synthase 1 [Capronia epimyces CBS 606.96]EXJ92751.1 prostaglandin-endoperoxide synthase 1 [Capronia epimyces CBS 606.96]
MPLLRRLSSKFKSHKTAKPDRNGVDGALTAVHEKASPIVNGDHTSDPQTAGSSLGQSLEKTKHVQPLSSYSPASAEPPPEPAVNGDNAPATRKDVEKIFHEFAQLIHASRRPLPSQSGDGQYLDKEEPTGFLSDLPHLRLKDVKAATHIVEDALSGKPVDDRKMHMEEVMQLVAALPDGSANRVELTSKLLDVLWNSLQHPPMSYLGDEFRYRSADGSNNSYIFPKLGAANTPYARSVNPKTVQPGALPDPGLLFDSLLAREEFKPHPNQVSSIFFNWASLIIHDLFQTDHQDYSISKTSSYLDLSILYGDTQEDQNMMRTFENGRIKPDCFAEERLLAFPPACGVMLILLNRFHNYVVDQLALINENGRFNKPSDRLSGDAAKAAWKKYDNDLFQTGRLITCGLYINITLHDYLRTIVNLNRTNSTWTLDPRLDKPKTFGNDGTPRGVGNQVSAEFSLSYRWHSCIGQTDEAWTEAVYKELFGKPPDEVSLRELMVGLGKYDHDLPKDPQERPFAHLKRNADGRFDDGELATIMRGGIEQVAGAFGARNIPKSMRAITILGINQSRSWNLCTLNEYRKFFGLRPYDTFEEVNRDPYVADQLKNLYEHPDYIELYPGLAVEEYKEPMVPGVGICPNHTISRVVLSDAVALVRGDRFYTLDYSPKNLTNWGYNEVGFDLSINQGCVFYKLLLRGLPSHFKPNSIYAHYPMTIPSENAKIMKDLGRYHDYDWSTPAYIPSRVDLTSYQSAKYLLERPKDFTVMWNDGLGFVMGTGGEKFCLGGDTPLHRKQRETMQQLIYRDRWHEHVKHFYEAITLRLLHEKSCKIAGINQVDLTRDVGNLAHVHFASNMFALPLKSAENPKGIFSEQELWMAMSVIFTAIFFDFEPTKSFGLRTVARKLATMLGTLIEANVKSVTATSLVAKLVDGFRENDNALADYGVHMIRRLSETGMSTSDIVFSQILPTACAMVPNQSQVFTQIMDYYLSPEGLKHWPEIQRLSRIDSRESDDKLLRYVNEAIRLNGTFGSYRRSEVHHVFAHEEGQPVSVKPGDKVFCSFVSAARDPKIFPDPDEVRLDRPLDAYIHYGIGEHTCLGKEASMVALTAMLRTVGKLENLRRAPGAQGELKKVPRPGGFYVYMREDQGSYFVFPCTFKVHYDGTLPPLPQVKAEH